MTHFLCLPRAMPGYKQNGFFGNQGHTECDLMCVIFDGLVSLLKCLCTYMFWGCSTNKRAKQYTWYIFCYITLQCQKYLKMLSYYVVSYCVFACQEGILSLIPVLGYCTILWVTLFFFFGEMCPCHLMPTEDSAGFPWAGGQFLIPSTPPFLPTETRQPSYYTCSTESDRVAAVPLPSVCLPLNSLSLMKTSEDGARFCLLIQ